MARPRQFDEQRVLQAVRDQFWETGYTATSLQDLMRVTGLGKGSLYAAYGDKRQLFLRVLRSYAESTQHGITTLIESTPRAIDALRGFVMAPACDPEGELLRASAVHRGCFLARSTSELAESDPDVSAEARRTYESITLVLAECVERAQHDGDLPAELDPTRTARTLLAAQQGLGFMGRTGMDVTTLAATAQALTTQLLHR